LKATSAQCLAAARAFHRRHGHLNVPSGTIVDGVDVGAWLSARRQDARAGRLTIAEPPPADVT
jgi:hypothetical protein